jgi:hypothetical protein
MSPTSRIRHYATFLLLFALACASGSAGWQLYPFRQPFPQAGRPTGGLVIVTSNPHIAVSLNSALTISRGASGTVTIGFSDIPSRGIWHWLLIGTGNDRFQSPPGSPPVPQAPIPMFEGACSRNKDRTIYAREALVTSGIGPGRATIIYGAGSANGVVSSTWGTSTTSDGNLGEGYFNSSVISLDFPYIQHESQLGYLVGAAPYLGSPERTWQMGRFVFKASTFCIGTDTYYSPARTDVEATVSYGLGDLHLIASTPASSQSTVLAAHSDQSIHSLQWEFANDDDLNEASRQTFYAGILGGLAVSLAVAALLELLRG